MTAAAVRGACASAGNEAPQAGGYLSCLRRVLMRGSSVIESKWPLRESFVDFSLRLDGCHGALEDVPFRARVEFFPFLVIVYHGRTGVRICQSVEGNAFELDEREGHWGLIGEDDDSAPGMQGGRNA